MGTRTAARLFLGSVALLLASAAMTQQPSVKPVASVTQLMRAMVIPASNALFNVAGEAPEADSDWDAVENNAVILAESGNLLLVGNRAKDQVWTKTSLAMVDAGAAALKAARDVDAIIEVGNQIVDACETCHDTHWDRSRN